MSSLPLLALLLLAADPPAAEAKFDGLDSAGWLAKLEDKVDDDGRRKACYALGTIRPIAPGTVAALAKHLTDAKSEPSWYAADALARLGPAAVDALPELQHALTLTQDYLAPTRRLSARAIGNIGPAAKDALPALDKAIAGDDPLLRVAASLARWKITGDVASLRPLTDALQADKRDAAFEAALALREVGSAAKPASTLLVKALAHKDLDVRRAVASTLAGLGVEAIGPLNAALAMRDGKLDVALAAGVLGQIATQLRATIIDKAGVLPDQKAAAITRCEQELAPPLAVLLADASPEVRSAAADALARVGLPALPLLVTALAEGNAETRAAAADALRELEPQLAKGSVEPYRGRTIPPTILLLRRTEPDLRQAAFRLFAALRVTPTEGEEARPLLRAALKDEDLAVRTYAVEALERLDKK